MPFQDCLLSRGTTRLTRRSHVAHPRTYAEHSSLSRQNSHLRRRDDPSATVAARWAVSKNTAKDRNTRKKPNEGTVLESTAAWRGWLGKGVEGTGWTEAFERPGQDQKSFWEFSQSPRMSSTSLGPNHVLMATHVGLVPQVTRMSVTRRKYFLCKLMKKKTIRGS